MTDIHFDVELGRIKKRYGDIVSINAAQTAGFTFCPEESYSTPSGSTRRIFAVWTREDRTADEAEQEKMLSEITSGQTTIPPALFNRSGAYSVTVISWVENTTSTITTYASIPTTSSFRSTECYRGNILESGYSDGPYNNGYQGDIYGLIKSLTTAKVNADILSAITTVAGSGFISDTNNNGLADEIAAKIAELNTSIAQLVQFAAKVSDFASDNLDYEGADYTEQTHLVSALNALSAYIDDDAADFVDDLKDSVRTELNYWLDYIGNNIIYVNDVHDQETEVQAKTIIKSMLDNLIEHWNYGYIDAFYAVQEYIEENASPEISYTEITRSSATSDALSTFRNEFSKLSDMIDILLTDHSDLSNIKSVLYNLLHTYLVYSGANSIQAMKNYIDDTTTPKGGGIRYVDILKKFFAEMIIILNSAGYFNVGIDTTGSSSTSHIDTVTEAYDYIKSQNDYANAGMREFLNSFATKLAAALADYTNESYTNYTYDELIDELEDVFGEVEDVVDEAEEAIETNTVLIRNNQQKITTYDMFKTIYEQSTNFPSILMRSNGIVELYSVPYINTSLLNVSMSNASPRISPYIQKLGFDLSSAQNGCITSGTEQLFRYATEMTDLKLTNCQTQTYWGSAFRFCSALKNIELYGFNANHNSVNVGFMFGHTTNTAATNLESINFVNGVCTEELDLTGITSFSYAFTKCNSLKNIRVVANSIQASISFADSSLLTKESVLSIINGLDSSNPATLSLHNTIKTALDGWYAKYDATSGVYVNCESTDANSLSYGDIISDGKGWTY